MSHIRQSAKRIPTLKQFLLHAESIHLYRRLLRLTTHISDRDERLQMQKYIRHEFDIVQHIADEDHIKQLQRDGRQQADRLEKIIMIAK